MCDRHDEARRWGLYVQDMIEFAEKVLSYTEGMDQKALIADGRTYDAALRNIELIGEAATHVPVQVRQAHPEIAWRRIVGSRNRVALGGGFQRAVKQRYPFALSLSKGRPWFDRLTTNGFRGVRKHPLTYLGIDDDVVWDVIRTDIPDLLPKLRRLSDSVEEGRP